MKDGVTGHRDTARLIDLITRHRARLEDQFDRDEINEKIHEALELRFAAPSSNSVFLGSVEDMVGFEISHPAFRTDISFAGTCVALSDSGCVLIVTSDRKSTRKKAVRCWRYSQVENFGCRSTPSARSQRCRAV